MYILFNFTFFLEDAIAMASGAAGNDDLNLGAFVTSASESSSGSDDDENKRAPRVGEWVEVRVMGNSPGQYNQYIELHFIP